MSATQHHIRALLGELIERETGLTLENDPENFTIARDYAFSKAKGHKYARTNQFDVIARLEGLVEKFQIVNGEALAGALEARIAELKSRVDIGGVNNFVPESLHLLLELSDEPLKHTNLSDLDLLIPSLPPKELTWEDIVADDPLEGEIWNDVDFGAESSDAWSGDETSVLPIRERLRRAAEEAQYNQTKRRKRRGSSVSSEDDPEEAYRAAEVEAHMPGGDREGLEFLKDSQYWERNVVPVQEELDVALIGSAQLESVWLVSELQALREVIFMLLGHPCVLLRKGRENDENVVWVNPEEYQKRFALRHTSLQGFDVLLDWFAAKGTILNIIRAFIRNKEDSPERQSFIAAVEEKVSELDKELVSIEDKYVGRGNPQPVSLLALQSQLDTMISPFASLCRIITNLDTTSHLEQLYLAACALQSTGNIPNYTFIATIFFSCLRTYLRPIRQWMESGTIPPTADFLISQTKPDEEIDLGTFWHTQYALRRTPHGSLQAPSFVHPVASRILTTGKSVVFLKHLLPTDTMLAPSPPSTPDLTFSTVCPPGTDLAPFSSLFLAAFNRWISARHHSISSRLRNHLLTRTLWHSLDALDLIYLSRNGYLFETLAQNIFEKLDLHSALWSDRFLLTEQIQSVFSHHPSIDPTRLRMVSTTATTPRPTRDSSGKRSVSALTPVSITYRLPWPVLNILGQTPTATYARIFTFLLQLRRARYLLTRLPTARHESPHFYALKQRLLWFSASVLAYLTDLVLRPCGDRLRRDMHIAQDVDAMVHTHHTFLVAIEEQCLLGPRLRPIHDAILAVLNIAVRFCRVQEALRGPSSSTPHRRRPSDASDSESEAEDAPGSPSSTGATTVRGEEGVAEREAESSEVRYERRMKEMVEELAGLVGFVREGLRGVARAGVVPHLEMLAEALEGYGAGGWVG